MNKYLIKKVIIISLLTLATGLTDITYAENTSDEKSEKGYNNLLGISFSTLTGAGPSYGYRFLPEYMIKICGLYFENKDKEKNNGKVYYTQDIWWNCGAELQKNIFSINTDNTCIEAYGLIGGSYKYDEFKDPEDPEGDDKSETIVGGLALGTRVILFQRVSINIDFGYQYSRDINDDERYTGLAGTIGAHILF